MGLRKWLAGNVAGPEGYGSFMGRQAREGGSALANAVFLSHGSRAGAGPTRIFDATSEMETAGFSARYEKFSKLDVTSLTADQQCLFRGVTTAMISYAFILNSNGALQIMRRDNTLKFRNGLGPSLLRSMVDCGLFGDIEAARTALIRYTKLADSTSITTILNMEKPASGDLLEHFIVQSVEPSGIAVQYGFIRTGITGFDIVAVPLVEEALRAIAVAAQQYGW